MELEKKSSDKFMKLIKDLKRAGKNLDRVTQMFDDMEHLTSRPGGFMGRPGEYLKIGKKNG